MNLKTLHFRPFTISALCARLARARVLALWVGLFGGSFGGVAACGGSAPDGKVDYEVTAKKNYDAGEQELADEDWIAAAKYFSFIKARFPYSKYAVLAELRLADAEFGAGNNLQAIDNYKLFIKFHPTHESVEDGYAAFRIAEAYFKLLPGDFFILPPSHEKDQSSSSDAHRELRSFVVRYEKSSYHAKAKEMLRDINRRLAAHELYVAQFYWERDRPMGSVLRLKRLLKDHPGTGLDGDALYLLGRAYLRVEMPARAKEAFETLVNDFPKHKEARRAKSQLTRLSKK